MPVPSSDTTSHSCKRGQHENCALRYLLTKKTGRLTPDPLKLPKVNLVPETEVWAVMVCPCACHPHDPNE